MDKSLFLESESSTRCGRQSNPKPKGISGWLIIPALNLIAMPIVWATRLLLDLSSLPSYPPDLSTDPRLWLWALIQVGMIVASVFVAVLFFMRRRAAVTGIIGLMVGSIIAESRITALYSSIMPHTKADPYSAPLIYSAIWVLYFLMSKRVKNTFRVVGSRAK
jgi:hypothetical protein